jgi:hypothetical protein
MPLQMSKSQFGAGNPFPFWESKSLKSPLRGLGTSPVGLVRDLSAGRCLRPARFGPAGLNHEVLMLARGRTQENLMP